MEFWWSFLILILFTIIFFLVIGENVDINRCPYPGGECFDGNGKYQYKGRGCIKEDYPVLLNRIDWLAKNSSNKPLYTTAYILAYSILLAILVINYAFNQCILTSWEIIVYIFAAFVICFSILNLFDFHTDRYPAYYIRQNIEYLSKQLRFKIEEPPHPCKSKVPDRTKVRDILS